MSSASRTRPKTAIQGNKSNLESLENEKQQKNLNNEVNNEETKQPLIFQKSPVLAIFEDELQAEIFNARCHDTAEPMTLEKAKVFKEEFLRANTGKNTKTLNLNTMRLGVNSIIALSNVLQSREIEVLNLADNSISDYGMNAIKSIINHTSVKYLNIASNMISQAGLEMILDDLMKNNVLKSLDLGVLEGSIRKNSIEIDGAKCIAAIILHNKNIEALKLQDNDITMAGGEIIGAALKQNKTLKSLKIAENDLKTEGAEFIIRNSYNLEELDLGKNYITSKIGVIIKSFLDTSHNIRRLNLEFNELFQTGVEMIAFGLKTSSSLISLNLKGNAIRDEGLECLADALSENHYLEELDISLNEITQVGMMSLAEVLGHSNLKILNISKNLLGDESLVFLADGLKKNEKGSVLEKIDFSSSRVGDSGILYFLEKTEGCETLRNIKAKDNFISEKIEKILIDILERNSSLIQLSLKGNRLSVCCLNRIRKILLRNTKNLEDKEPNKLKTEIYRLKYEQRKILIAKDRLKQQEKEINKLEEIKNNISTDNERLKLQEFSKRQAISERIEEQKAILNRKNRTMKEKNEDFLKLKQKHEAELSELTEQKNQIIEKRMKISEEVLKIHKDIADQEKYYQDIINDLSESLIHVKKKTVELEKNTATLNEDFRVLTKELEKKEQENLERELTIIPEKKTAQGKRNSTAVSAGLKRNSTVGGLGKRASISIKKEKN